MCQGYVCRQAGFVAVLIRSSASPWSQSALRAAAHLAGAPLREANPFALLLDPIPIDVRAAAAIELMCGRIEEPQPTTDG